LNENLRRALLRARLTDEDVAARLEVDPKTVRRWLEGRTPYLRHRWALASILGLDETDLWPQVRGAQSLPPEIRAIYPHRADVPAEIWRNFFNSAEQEIGILADSAPFLITETDILTALTDRAKAGVQERLCLRDPNWSEPDAAADLTRKALTRFADLNESHSVQIRLCRVFLNNAIYRADNDLLISQQAFGIPGEQMPVIHVRQTARSDLALVYLQSFDSIWSAAQPLNEAWPPC
jgi:transcriptional regulator with XRE-family HTH domain